MGCGASISEPVNRQIVQNNESSSESTASSRSISRTASTSSRRQTSGGSLNQFNRRHVPLTVSSTQGSYTHGRPINPQQLEEERRQFWETRVGGDVNMWNSLRTAAEACLSGDLPLANAILEASNLSTPHGTLEVCYDERGYEYVLPAYCRMNPNDLIISSSTTTTQATGNNNQNNSPSPSHQSATKGKGNSNLPVATPLPITVRVRINPGEYNVKLTNLTTNDSILDLKTYISTLYSVSPAEGEKDEENDLVTAAVECIPSKHGEEDDSSVPWVGADGISVNDPPINSKGDDSTGNSSNNNAEKEKQKKTATATSTSTVKPAATAKTILPIVCEPTRQRVIFMGRELQNAQRLGEIGVDESKVVQIFLRPKK